MHHHQSTVLWHSIHSAIIHYIVLTKPHYDTNDLHTWNNM